MKIIKKKLKNGLRYILVPMTGTQVVTSMVLVGTGSYYESKKQSGIAHFIEHMCFKGTPTRPSAFDIALEFDRMGAQNNAFTGNISTGYWAKAHKKHTSHVLDILADIYKNPLFPEKDMDREKGVVIQEISMYEDDAPTKAMSVLADLVFGDTPEGREIAGTKENVAGFTRKDLLAYHKKNYTPENTVVVLAGAVSPAQIEKEIARLFSTAPKAVAPKLAKRTWKHTGPHVRVFNKKTDQTHFAMYFKSFDMFHPQARYASMLGTVLSGGMSSRLFKKMREELGICYYVNAANSSGLTQGEFVLNAGVAAERLEEAVEGILIELRKMIDEEVTADELRKVKDMSISSMAIGLEKSDNVADYCAFQELHKKHIETMEEKIKRLEAVKALDIQAVAKKIFTPQTAHIAVVSPLKTTDKARDERIKKLFVKYLG